MFAIAAGLRPEHGTSGVSIGVLTDEVDELIIDGATARGSDLVNATKVASSAAIDLRNTGLVPMTGATVTAVAIVGTGCTAVNGCETGVGVRGSAQAPVTIIDNDRLPGCETRSPDCATLTKVDWSALPRSVGAMQDEWNPLYGYGDEHHASKQWLGIDDPESVQPYRLRWVEIDERWLTLLAPTPDHWILMHGHVPLLASTREIRVGAAPGGVFVRSWSDGARANDAPAEGRHDARYAPRSQPHVAAHLRIPCGRERDPDASGSGVARPRQHRRDHVIDRAI